MTANRQRSIAAVIETSSSYGRNLFAGLVRYRTAHRNWNVLTDQRDIHEKPPHWLSDWSGDGILCRATTPELATAIKATGIPFVDLTDRGEETVLPYVWSDDAEIGRMAASHLIERGYRRFAFCGFSSEAWSARRRDAFINAVKELIGPSEEVAVFESIWHGPEAVRWDVERERIAQWLADLPSPLGLMTCNDIRGRHVLDACSSAGLSVPEQIAVIGVDDDELICQFCAPPLSSVVPNSELVGFTACETLATLMDGGSPPPRQVIPPIHVRVRASSDSIAIDNDQLASALSFIRERACEGITVEDAAKHASMCRSTLERHTRSFLGRSPRQEIRRVRLERVKELLRCTDYPIAKVAELCGFEHPEYMFVMFKREIGVTPAEFRRAIPSRRVT